jgi:PKHD-type hydroxylase
LSDYDVFILSSVKISTMENNSTLLPGTYIHIPKLLSPELLTQVLQLTGQLHFVDGKATASGAAKEIKQNLQADKSSPILPQVQQLVLQALGSHPLIQMGLMPKYVVPPMISKYEPGMSYGWHTDSPIMMGDQAPLRVDASMTLFLSDPGTYDGGELIIHTDSGYQTFKLPAGDAIIYPTTRLHAVMEVKQGIRMAAVTWLQCAVKEAAKRELLFQLKYVQESIAAQNLHSMENQLLMQVHSNLVRMWTEM